MSAAPFCFSALNSGGGWSSTCNGGTCVPDPRPGAIINSSLCSCASAGDLTGGADYFDLNVAIDPTTGETLSLACVQSKTGETVVWSLLLITTIVRIIIAVRAFVQQTRTSKHGSAAWASRDVKKILGFMPFRTLLIDLLVISPLAIIACATKLAFPGQATLGTDPLTTCTLVLSVGILLFMWADFTTAEFSILVKSRSMGREGSDKVIRKYLVNQVFLAISYSLVSVVPTFICLSLDKSLGPIDSGEFIILLVRNIGVMLWQILALTGSFSMKRQVDGLMATLDPVVAARSMAVIEYLDADRKTIAIKNCVAFVVYVGFSTPWAWYFQTYATAIMMILVMEGMAPGKILTKSQKSSKSSVTSSDAAKRALLTKQDSSPLSGSFTSPRNGAARPGQESAMASSMIMPSTIDGLQ